MNSSSVSPLSLARAYLKCFFGEQPLENMRPLLADKLVFRGPLYEFNSANLYMAALFSEPAEIMGYEIVEAFENETSACVIYTFEKAGVQTRMAQLFRVENGLIAKIDLIFDSTAFF